MDDGGIHLVLTGGDRAADLVKLGETLDMRNRITVLGSISPSEMRAVYEMSSLVAMPTLLGPSNLPPLEAWTYGVPLVYNRDFADFAGDAAEYADPLDSLDLQRAILRALDPERSRELASQGRKRLELLRSQSDAATAEISRRLSVLIKIKSQ
jgi:hypothetical protein